MGNIADQRNLLMARLKKAFVEASDQHVAAKAVDNIVCSTEFDSLDRRQRMFIMFYLAGLEEAWYHCKGWREGDRRFGVGDSDDTAVKS